MSRFDRFWMEYGGLILAMLLALVLIWFGWDDLMMWVE